MKLAVIPIIIDVLSKVTKGFVQRKSSKIVKVIIIEHKRDRDTNYNWHARYSHQNIGAGTGELGNKRTSGDYPSYSTDEIGQNTRNKLEDLRRIAVTQTPVKTISFNGCNSFSNELQIGTEEIQG